MDEEQPKKYIRTFGGDIETMQKGGKPDLVPLVGPSARERLIAASPLNNPQGGLSGDRSAKQNGLAEPISIVLPSPLAPPKPAGPTPIETYASDFSARVKEGNASFATVLAAEQDSGLPKPEVVEQKIPRSSIYYSIAGVALLIAGLAGVAFAYTRYMAATAPIIPALQTEAPIFVDERAQISGTGQALVQAIEQSVTRPLPLGAVRLLYLASSTASGSIFSALRTSAPDVLLRNVNAEGSMAGIVNVGGVQSPFFILSVVSYSDTFAGMLTWERSMPRDFEKLFPPYPLPAVNTPAATSTLAMTTRNAPVVAVAFRDEVAGNHDVRVYRDARGGSVFLYGYWNQATLIIARDPAAFAEILGRLATSRAQP